MALKLDTPAAGRVSVLAGLDPASYVRHAVHQTTALWPEKNCYADLWIELLHACGEPAEAMLPFVVAVDFDGDQWTFFKPSHDELWELYGIKVQELTVWRPWIEHAFEHLSAGALLSVEVDSFWLPDTAGTDYRAKHGKTTFVFNDLDVAQRRLGYFHNAGYCTLEGEDFDATLQTAAAAPGEVRLPLFAERVMPPRARGQHDVAARLDAQRRCSLDLMQRHLQRVPAVNPVTRFATRFAADLPALQARGLEHYHAWAFAGTRQLGAAFELAAAWLDWVAPALNPATAPDQALARAAMLAVSADAKGLILKGARAVALHRPFDVVAHLAPTAQRWQDAMDTLRRLTAPTVRPATP